MINYIKYMCIKGEFDSSPLYLNGRHVKELETTPLQRQLTVLGSTCTVDHLHLVIQKLPAELIHIASVEITYEDNTTYEIKVKDYDIMFI